MIPPQLRHVLPLIDAGVQQCQPLRQGLNNQTWRVRTGAGDWVVRINGNNDGVDREFECRVLAAVGAAELAPPVIDCDPKRGYLITRFVAQAPWSRNQFNDPAAVKALARSLRRLHDLHEPLEDAADWQAQLADSFASGPLADNQAVREGIGALCEDLAATGFDQGPVALCHHDLHAAHLLGLEQVQFIDWEYARWTHPAMDIAFLIQYHDLVPEQRDLLMAAYYGHTGRDAAQFMALAVRLAQYQEMLWLARFAGALETSNAARLRALMLVLA